jgi:hypothetical protein
MNEIKTIKELNANEFMRIVNELIKMDWTIGALGCFPCRSFTETVGKKNLTQFDDIYWWAILTR